jgi:hypothetical protein
VLFISLGARLVSFQRKSQKNSNQCARLSIEGSRLYNSTKSSHPREDLDRDVVSFKIPRLSFYPAAQLSALRETGTLRHFRGHTLALYGAHVSLQLICLNLVPMKVTPKSIFFKLLCWGYIVTFAKVLTIFQHWIHSFRHSPLPSSLYF